MTKVTKRAVLAGFAGSFAAHNLAFSTLASAQDAVEPMDDLFVGDPDAPITVIEYASMTCPHCARFHTDVYPQLKENFIDTGKVKFVFREVYFDKFGLWSGMLARCGSPDRYFPFVDLLFKKQDEWRQGNSDQEIVGNLFKLGRQTGLTDEEMTACVQNQEMAQALVADYQLKSGQDGISATPTFVIDGEKVSNMSYDAFEALLNEKLE
jgi:protein-disulfide isomerase